MSIYITPQMLNRKSHSLKKFESPGIFGQAWIALALRRQRRKMIAALEAMDDRLLSDIGICRGDIRRVVG